MPSARALSEPRLCVVIPTYNEAPNVAALLRRLSALHPGGGATFLVVDDDSPDGTAAVVRELSGLDPRIELLPGPRRGLGQAYVRGIGHALGPLRAEVVVQMDADGSHDPGDVQRLLARLFDPDDPVDVAIGSRYVPGGSLDRSWPRRRRLLSAWGNRAARRVARLRGVRDCTAGFKALRAPVLRRAMGTGLPVRGHAFQVLLLHRLQCAGARVAEVPIHFRERTAGEPKLGLPAIVEFFSVLCLLRLARVRTFVRCALTGLSGVVVNLGSFHLLHQAGLPVLLASPLAIQLSITSNFLLHVSWTFADRALGTGLPLRALRYHLVALSTLALGTAIFAALRWAFPDAAPLLLQACAAVPGLVHGYLLSARRAFGVHPS